MLPDRVSNPGPLTYESGALPTALRRPAIVPSGGRKTSPRTSPIVQIIFYFSPLRIEDIF